MKHSNGTCKTRTGQDAETRQGTRFTSTLKDGALSLKKVDERADDDERAEDAPQPERARGHGDGQPAAACSTPMRALSRCPQTSQPMPNVIQPTRKNMSR